LVPGAPRAHTHAIFGVPQKNFWTDDLSDRRKFPNLREIASYTIHSDYDPRVTSEDAEEVRPPNDIAIAVIKDGAPSGTQGD